jgi:hypothetical protein
MRRGESLKRVLQCHGDDLLGIMIFANWHIKCVHKNHKSGPDLSWHFSPVSSDCFDSLFHKYTTLDFHDPDRVSATSYS